MRWVKTVWMIRTSVFEVFAIVSRGIREGNKITGMGFEHGWHSVQQTLHPWR